VTGHVITQLTHHAANDDSTQIAGRVTILSLDESGRARFRAAIAPTEAGRTIAASLDTSDGQAPFLRGVSIRGQWIGNTRIEKGPDGEPVETADDLEILGLDYTHKPGVPVAVVDTFAWSKNGAKQETDERVLITESVQEALVGTITEYATPAAPDAPPEVRAALAAIFPEKAHRLVDGQCVTCEAEEAALPLSKRGSGLSGSGKVYADPGYQADKKQRYDLSSKANAKAAWSYINQADNAAKYTAAQLKRVKARIVKALKKFGVTVACMPSRAYPHSGQQPARRQWPKHAVAGRRPGSLAGDRRDLAGGRRDDRHRLVH
jgi:hypothetical protein